MTATLQASAAAPAPARGPLAGRTGTALLVAALLSCAAGLVGGLVAGPLWLDEALTVEIAGRPLPDLYAALRQDGAPPLYYLLLRGWMLLVGDGTVAVRLLTVLMVPVALALAALLGRRTAGRDGALAAVVVLAGLPWTMRYGSETRMYLLVVVLSLAGALALEAVRTSTSRRAVLALGACAGALLLTHYWSLFLLAVVGAWHLPGLLRREAVAARVAVGLGVGAVLFSPWAPTFLFQAARTGAPWAGAPGLLDLLRTPTYWGGGPFSGRVALAVVLVPLVVLGAVRLRRARALAGVAGATLLLAFVAAQASSAYTGRYTAVVVPLVAVAAGLGATTLPGRWPVLALGVFVLVGAVTGVRATTVSRTSADDIAEAFLAEASPGDVLVYCPDQLGPPVSRAIGEGYQQVVYPTLAGPELVDWVDYEQRNDAADPAAVARQVDALAGDRQLFVLKATGYRTFETDDDSTREDEDADSRGDEDRVEPDDCDALLAGVSALRGLPEHLFGELGTTGQQLFRFDRR